ncbi:MAG: hypothetical protein IBJ09_01975 [Bacteroidia bacterium]|nr:hypothetical protein [Bacteroidia bacterium]
MKNLSVILLFMALTFSVQAQTSKRTRTSNVRDTSVAITMVRPQAAFILPMGELMDRTGFFYTVGGSILTKTASQWMFGAEGCFYNGNIIREPGHLQNLLTSEGGLIAQSGEFGDVNRFFRGFSFSALFGRLFPVGKPNMNSGFYVTFGLGYIQHKIRTEVRGNNVWPLNGDYKKGYDRLSGGFMLSQFAGYQYINNKRTITFFAGLELNQALVKSYRGFNYDTQEIDNRWKFNGMFSVKGGWLFNIYHRKQTKEYWK